MSQAKTVTVLYFAAALSETGIPQEKISIPSDKEFKLSDLPELLISQHPDSELDKILETSRWSVNLEMVDEPPDQVGLVGGEEIGVICPVSGG